MRASVKMWQLFVAIAMTLVLAAIGTAIATIPDANGVIQACYKKANPNRGLVRLIDTDLGQTCPSGYKPISWNQQGPEGLQGEQGIQGIQGEPGTEIAARLRLASPVTVATEEPVDLPLDPGAWIQKADALNMIYARLEITAPDVLDCNSGASVTLNIFLDGTRLNSWQTSTLGGLTIARGATRTLEFSFVEQKLGGVHFGHVLFERDADTEHTIAVTGQSTCEGTTFDEVSFDVVSVG